MGISFAAGMVAGNIIKLDGSNTWANFLAHPIETVAQGALAGALSGAASSAVYGGKTWDAVGKGALAGAAGVGVALGTEAALGAMRLEDALNSSAKNSVASAGGGNIIKEYNKDSPVIQACDFGSTDDTASQEVIQSQETTVDIDKGACPACEITKISNRDWNKYIFDVRAQVQKYSRLNPFGNATLDTYLNGHCLDNDQSSYYIEPLKMVARGYEINYVAQGMYQNRSWTFTYSMGKVEMYIWKLANKPFCNEWYKFPGFGDRAPYKLPTANEKFFYNYGFKHY